MPANAVLFGVMGGDVQVLVSVAVAVVLWRSVPRRSPLGWALRFGMTLTIVGALTGPLMMLTAYSSLLPALEQR